MNPMNQTSVKEDSNRVPLPDANVVLALGIGSVFLCWCQGIVGLVMAIVALVLANRNISLYYANPGKYSDHSFNNVKTGRTIAIIGLILAVMFFFLLIIGLLFLGLNFAFFPWEMIDI